METLEHNQEGVFQKNVGVKEDFYFTIGRNGNKTFLRFSFTNSKNRRIPDFRRFIGKEREALRDFLERKQSQEHTYNFEKETDDDHTLTNPDSGFIEKLLYAGLLRNNKGDILTKAEGNYNCALFIEDTKNNSVNVSLLLHNENGIIKQKNSFYTLSPNLVIKDDKVYFIEDLGINWAETEKANTQILKSELSTFLSLMISTFSNLKIIYQGFSIKQKYSVAALPALLFMERDQWNYLHVKAINYIHNFHLLFLENENIVSSVEINEEEKTISIAEIIFPYDPANMFRTMLNKNKAKIKNSVHEENGQFIIEQKFATDFFGEQIIELAQNFVLLETQILAGYKLRFSKPKIRFSIGKGIDYLSGNAAIEFEGETFSFAKFMAEYKKTSYIMLSDNVRAFPDKKIMQKLERFISKIKGSEELAISYYDIPLLLKEKNIEIEGNTWEETRSFFTNYNSISDRKNNFSLSNGELRPYQEYGVRWLDYLMEHKMGACLADEMGLGKTIQVIALLRHFYEKGVQGKYLILCTKTIIFNWRLELTKFAHELPCTVYYGSDRNTSCLEGNDFRIILSTYSTLRQDVDDFKHFNFFYIILDESQNIKNLNTQTTAAVLSLNAIHKIAMSGTPIENNLGELYSLFRFLNPNFFGSERLFRTHYLNPIQDEGNDEALQDLRTKMYPFILRRLKKDVLSDLPPKTEETIYIELETEHLSLYHQRRKEFKDMIGKLIAKGEYSQAPFIIFKALAELRRLASVPESEGEYFGISAKREYLKNIVSSITENGHKCLIFTNFLATVDLVSNDLKEIGIENLTMTGATVDRQSLVSRFQNDSNVKAFIMTLKTGGTGINLTKADYIFIFDPWWNSAVEQQAIDRSHRIGQVNPVFCYRFIAKDTIEERIMELQNRKTNLASSLLVEDENFFKTLTQDDVVYLMGGGSYEN